MIGRRRLAAMAAARFGAGLAVMLALLLLTAGTCGYWEAWLYILTFFLPAGYVVVYLLRNDPGLLERRLRGGERQAGQRLIIRLGTTCSALTYLLPGLDRRLGWSDVPVAAVVAGDAVFLASYGLFFLVLRANRYASRVIEVERGQQVVSTGPYAVVRHPMYAAVLGMFLSTPVALGSWWALLPAVPMAALLCMRIRGEEQVLVRELEGYAAYMRTVRYRLLPGVW